MATVLTFSAQPELELGSPLTLGIDHVRIALVDFTVAIQQATTIEQTRAIRKQIAARVLELEAVEGMAVDREIALERDEDRAVDAILADIQRVAQES